MKRFLGLSVILSFVFLLLVTTVTSVQAQTTADSAECILTAEHQEGNPFVWDFTVEFLTDEIPNLIIFKEYQVSWYPGYEYRTNGKVLRIEGIQLPFYFDMELDTAIYWDSEKKCQYMVSISKSEYYATMPPLNCWIIVTDTDLPNIKRLEAGWENVFHIYGDNERWRSRYAAPTISLGGGEVIIRPDGSDQYRNSIITGEYRKDASMQFDELVYPGPGIYTISFEVRQPGKALRCEEEVQVYGDYLPFLIASP